MFCICCWNRNCMPGFGIPLWCVIISLIIMLCCHWSELSYSPCMMIRLDMFWIPTSPVLFWALPTSLVTLSITQFPIWHSVAWTISLVTLSITQLPPVRKPCFGWAGSWLVGSTGPTGEPLKLQPALVAASQPNNYSVLMATSSSVFFSHQISTSYQSVNNIFLSQQISICHRP